MTSKNKMPANEKVKWPAEITVFWRNGKLCAYESTTRFVWSDERVYKLVRPTAPHRLPGKRKSQPRSVRKVKGK